MSRWHGGNVSDQTSKKLISLFSYPCHVAPGEAEAECAMLQKHGIVDAVMTQDVDAIMFGSGLTLRDWSKDGKAKGNKTPTHVSVFDLEKLKEISRGLNPEGMILVALLSGGDYDEDGVAGIGISLACDIATAGFGSDLLESVRNEDEEGIRDWRERLQYELESDESGYFKKKRKTVKIPEDFPNRKILDYYMNPAVTAQDELKKLERKWMKAWDQQVGVKALRDYAADTLDWRYKPGAWKFVRVLAPALLADRLRRGAAASLVTSADQITERRQNFVTDGIPELRVTVVPADVVGLDLDAEEDSPEYLDKLAAQKENDEAGEDDEETDVPASSQSPTKRRKAPPWLPWNAEKMWMAEAIVELGAKEHAAKWNQLQWEMQNDFKKFATRKCAPKKKEPQKAKKTGGMQLGAIHGYVVAAKSTNRADEPVKMSSDTVSSTITNILAAAESLLLPSPSAPRPKANMKVRRVVGTPTKSKTITSDQATSPSMLDYFNSTKSTQFLSSSQETETSDPKLEMKCVNTKLKEDEDPFISHEILAEKHSRLSTSSSADLPRHLPKKSSRQLPRYKLSVFPATISASPSHHEGSKMSKPLLVVVADEPQENADVLQKETSRPFSLIENNADPASSREELESFDDAEMLTNVTQRTPQRRIRKNRAAVISQASSPSPARPKRPIESFFQPYMKPNAQKAPATAAILAKSRRDLVAVPLELTTGLSTTFSVPTHLHAIPRSSLPGTWKEVDCESTPSSQVVTARSSRRPRVSIVDLTVD